MTSLIVNSGRETTVHTTVTTVFLLVVGWVQTGTSPDRSCTALWNFSGTHVVAQRVKTNDGVRFFS
jgi:hypothetical protein